MVSAISANENKMCAMNDANVDVDEICFASICFDDPKRWHISLYIIKKNYSQSGDIWRGVISFGFSWLFSYRTVFGTQRQKKPFKEKNIK